MTCVLRKSVFETALHLLAHNQLHRQGLDAGAGHERVAVQRHAAGLLKVQPVRQSHQRDLYQTYGRFDSQTRRRHDLRAAAVQR